MAVITPCVTKKDRLEAERNVNPPGRKCVNPDCITILNRYNHGPYCLLCAKKWKGDDSLFLARIEELGYQL